MVKEHLVSASAEERARALAEGSGQRAAVPADVAVKVLEEIAALSAWALSSDEECDVALRAITGLALAALAQMRR